MLFGMKLELFATLTSFALFGALYAYGNLKQENSALQDKFDFARTAVDQRELLKQRAEAENLLQECADALEKATR